MKRNQSFKVLFHDDWEQTTLNSAAATAVEPDGRFDPALVKGTMDVVVGGRSLVDHLAEDSVFFLMRDLLQAAERLVTGDHAARVSFYESPYELVFQRFGRVVLITFYRGGQFPEVVVKDQELNCVQLIGGICDSAGTLVKKTRELNQLAMTDPLVGWIDQIRNRLSSQLDKLDRDQFTKPVERKQPVEVTSTRWATPRTANGFSFGFRFVARDTDLLSPGQPLGNDLNGLLFRGQLVVHARIRRRVMGEGFLFLQVEKLLSAAQHLQAAWEEGRPMSVRLIAEGFSVGVRLTSDEQLTISIGNPTDESSLVVVNDVTIEEFMNGVLGVAREVRRFIVSTSPVQRKNIRLERFAREVKRLSQAARAQRKGALINRDVEPYKNQLELPTSQISQMTIPHRGAMMFQERWRLEAEGLDLGSTMLCGPVALVSARDMLIGVEAATGTVLWRRHMDRIDARLQVAGRDGFIRATLAGVVEMIDLASGVCRWKTTLAPRSGGAPVLLVSDQGPFPGLAVVAEEDRSLVALDLRTGEPKWRFQVNRGGRFSLRRVGRLLYVSSSDNQLLAVDLADGRCVWRFLERTRFYLPVALEKDGLFAVGGRPGKNDGVLFGVDAFSGERRWSVALKGSALTAPIVTAGVVMVPVGRNNKNDLVAFDVADGTELWRVACEGWAKSCALIALDSRFIVNLAGGRVIALNAQTGENEWSVELGPVCSDDIPLGLSMFLRGGALFVPADTVYVVNPETGAVVQSLSGDPPVPDMMQVNMDGSVFIAEESGHIGMYEIARSFTVVKGGL